ncbi:MAG: hypothetical protein IJP95_03930, partial [Bacteroidales bacterium]|nr:hypothetical protein [Bacteroidales bacterium]
QLFPFFSDGCWVLFAIDNGLRHRTTRKKKIIRIYFSQMALKAWFGLQILIFNSGGLLPLAMS